MDAKTRMTIVLPAAWREILEEDAKLANLSVSAIIREAILDHWERQIGNRNVVHIPSAKALEGNEEALRKFQHVRYRYRYSGDQKT